MKKRGKTAVAVLILLIGAALALVLLLMLTGKFTWLTERLAHKTQCMIEFAELSFLKRSPECEANYITIKLDKSDGKAETVDVESLLGKEKVTSATYYLNDYKNEARRRIKEWATDDKYANLPEEQQHFRKNYGEIDKEESTILLEYGMDKILADEVRNCWEIVWKGKFPYFDRWWKLIDWGKEVDEKTEKELVDLYFTKFKTGKPPVFCVLCSRIKFDKKVVNKFKDKKITSLTSLAGWMENTPISATNSMSYFEYTKDNIHRGLWEKGDRYNYEINEPPHALAVIYARVNKGFITHLFSQVKTGAKIGLNMVGFEFEFEKNEGDLNALFLVPYQDAAEKCTYMIG